MQHQWISRSILIEAHYNNDNNGKWRYWSAGQEAIRVNGPHLLADYSCKSN